MPQEAQARILVVEDEPDARQLLATALGLHGYDVRQAATAEEAADVLLAGERFDVMIADWDLPGRSGAALAAEQAAAGRLDRTAVLIVTAHPEPSGVEGLEVLTKPLDIDLLLGQVERLVAQREEPPPVPAAAQERQRVELVLYVTEGAPPSGRARRNVESVLAGFEPRHYTFTVCDLATDPLRAEADRVVFSPTLVKRRPAPPSWFLGDLSNTDALRDVLLLSGAARR